MPDARKARYQAAHRESHAIFVQPLSITKCQVDDLWSFVRKQEAHLIVAAKVLAL